MSSRRIRFDATSLLGTLLVGSSTAFGCVGERPTPHVVLVTADALRADHLSINGYPRETTPAIDAFARVSWHFTQAITVIPKTGPSFATLFSGRHPREHGVRSNLVALPEELPLLAERLQAAGYRTAAFVSNPVLRRSMGYARGFDRYDQEVRDVAGVNRAFLDWARPAWNRPTFVWLHYIDPHGPYTPPSDFEARFIDDEWTRSDARVPPHHAAARRASPNKLLGAVPFYVQRDREDRVAAYVARYDAEIRYMDAAFGEVLEFLRERGLYDESVVIFTSDHGESLGEHDLYFEHGWFAYEPSLRIPLLIKQPGQSEGRIVRDQVSNLDLVPTVLGLLGAAIDDDAWSRNLFGPPADRAPLLIENADHYPDKYVGLRTPQWKYLRRVRNGAEELYDLRADPRELRNLDSEEPKRKAALRASLSQALQVSRPAVTPSARPPADDPELIERLRALGYVAEQPASR